MVGGGPDAGAPVLRVVGVARLAPLDVPDVRRRPKETRVTKKTLFRALCELANALQDACVRVDFSPHTIALEATLERLDRVIDQVLEEGVHEAEPPARGPGQAHA